MVTISVAGASGYAGGELLRLLLAHPDVSLGAIAAGGRAGDRIVDVHPNLIALADRSFDATSAQVLGQADLVFLALPHGESASIAEQLPDTVRIVDLGADFRLTSSAAWEQFYGIPHAGTWTYGLPELDGNRARIQQSRQVANPGCYPTTVALALAPLLSAGLIETTGISVVAASGTSGAGRKPADAYLASQVMGSMSAYGVGGVHRHTPEIEQSLARAAGEAVTVSFTPLLAPMPRGMLSTCSAQVKPGASAAQLRAALLDAYAQEPFVIVLPEGVLPQTSSVLGTNAAQLQVVLDERVGRVIVLCALDNLGKGAAGQALQNANLMLGLSEGLGLTTNGVAP
ncbi:MAG: N-acetyl-gamma-glutamyl-phosphate reductase [Candidatus Nanopelagicales bacterium]|nr:N-acetyl-gamma-glutamyl-phosphate reductase [Candidatus Nanopelagicales bacterium]